MNLRIIKSRRELRQKHDKLNMSSFVIAKFHQKPKINRSRIQSRLPAKIIQKRRFKMHFFNKKRANFRLTRRKQNLPFRDQA